MDGRNRDAGAVTGVTATRNPISLARAVMEQSPHVFLSREGADQFSREQGLEQAAPECFETAERRRQLEVLRARPAADYFDEELKYGTVGAVAVDQEGHVAAATSTGGLTGKRWGRIGDSPIIGAGTYADDRGCAVSATGAGEYFIRVGVAHEICARMRMRGESAQRRRRRGDRRRRRAGRQRRRDRGHARGRRRLRFNTPGMYRGDGLGRAAARSRSTGTNACHDRAACCCASLLLARPRSSRLAGLAPGGNMAMKRSARSPISTSARAPGRDQPAAAPGAAARHADLPGADDRGRPATGPIASRRSARGSATPRPGTIRMSTSAGRSIRPPPAATAIASPPRSSAISACSPTAAAGARAADGARPSSSISWATCTSRCTPATKATSAATGFQATYGADRRADQSARDLGRLSGRPRHLARRRAKPRGSCPSSSAGRPRGDAPGQRRGLGARKLGRRAANSPTAR